MKRLYSLLFFVFLLFTISCDEEAALAAVECDQDFDCAGECGGTAVVGGCDETCGSTLENDDCGVCGGDGTTCSPVTFNFTGDVDTFDTDSFETSLASTLSCDVSQVEVVDYGYVSSSNRDEEMYVIVNFLESDSSDTSIDDLLQTVQTELSSGGSIGGYDVSAPVISNISEDACQSALDDCGICGGSGIPEGECDCFGNVNDCNGDCGGTAAEDCNGDCDGSAVVDACGDCGGDAESLDDCPICYNGSINTGLLGYWDGLTYSNDGDCDNDEIESHYNNIIEWNFEVYEEGDEILYAAYMGKGTNDYNEDMSNMTDDGPSTETGALSCTDNNSDGEIDENYVTFCPNDEYINDGSECFIVMIDLSDGNLEITQEESGEGADCTGTITFTQSEPSMCDDDMIDQEILGDWLGSNYSASSGCNPDETMTQDEIMQWWLQIEYDDGDYTFDAEQHENDCSEENLSNDEEDDTCSDSEEGIFSCAEIGNDVQMCFEEETYIDGMYDSYATDCQNVSLSVDLTTLTISNTYISYAENDTDYDICTETLTFVRPYTLDCISDCDANQLITFQSFIEDWDDDEISNEEAYSFCEWFLGEDDNGCLSDCGINSYLDQMMEMCDEAVEDYGASCEDSDSEYCFEDLDMDDNSYPDCISDCQGLDGLTEIDDPNAFCNVVIGFSENCISDCVFEGYNSIEALQGDCSSCIDAGDCDSLLYEDELGDDDNECDDEDDSCLDDCNLEGLEGNITEDPNAFCQIAVNVDLSCVEDCNGCDEGLSTIVALCVGCLALDNCNDVFAEELDEDVPVEPVTDTDYCYGNCCVDGWADNDCDGVCDCCYHQVDNECMDSGCYWTTNDSYPDGFCMTEDESIGGDPGAPPECMQDCPLIDDVDGENIDSVCDWIASVGELTNACFDDCSDEEMEFPMSLESVCSCYALTDSECADSSDCLFGNWDENTGCWPNFVFEEDESDNNHEYFCDEQGEITYYYSSEECESNCSDYCWMIESNDNDSGGGDWYCDALGEATYYNSSEECEANCGGNNCGQLASEVIINDCLEFFNEDEVDACTSFTDGVTCDQSDACDWDSDNNSCIPEGPPTCIWDCEGLCDWVSINSDVNSIDENPFGFCSWAVNTLSNSECSSDCDDNTTSYLEGYVGECQACLETDDPLSDTCQSIDGDDEDSQDDSDSGMMYQYFCDDSATYYDSSEECELNCTDYCWMEETDSGDDDDLHDGLPECFNDCSGYNELLACADGSCGWNSYCTYISSWNEDSCSSDCDGEDADILSVMGPMCDQCLAADNCEEMFGSDGNGDMNMDVEVPDCAMSCTVELALLGDTSGDSEEINFTDAQCDWIDAQSTDFSLVIDPQMTCSNDCNEQDQAAWSTYLTLMYALGCSSDSSGE
ncbi:MAG: hypothetical protein CMG13_00755 [Candidatus Marinimicrobia bacterium]|nr:hypothetical protein [Candidatus Neomarinimicrobiota bacterium]|tara:strand:+ start:4141 stop:8316 length:4176 start_codon:yes stop_codon:yes gene_type:complete